MFQSHTIEFAIITDILTLRMQLAKQYFTENEFDVSENRFVSAHWGRPGTVPKFTTAAQCPPLFLGTASPSSSRSTAPYVMCDHTIGTVRLDGMPLVYWKQET